MQKKLIALAVAGFAAAPAFAQSNVTIYGVMDAGYAHYSGTSVGVNPGAGATNNIDAGLQSGSRIGFKGEEALGNGLKAVFTAEYSINNDNAASQTARAGLGASRQMFVGLSGGFGTVTLGHQYNPFWEVVFALDPFATTGVGSASVIHPAVGEVARSGSSIKYAGSVAGVSISALYGMGEQNPNAATTTGSTFSWSALYGIGAGAVGATYIKLGDYGNGLGIPGVDVESTAVGGLYDFKVAKVSGFYNSLKANGPAGAATVVKHGDWMLGVTIPMGAHSIRVAYNKANDKLAANADANHWGLGYQYDLSKRTNIYAVYGNVSNKNGATYAVNPGATVATHGVLGGVAGTSRETGYAVGLRHSF